MSEKGRKDMFRMQNAILDTGILLSKKLRKGCASPPARLIAYSVLAFKVDQETQTCTCGLKEFSRLTGMCSDTASRAVHDLEFLGVIKIEKRFKKHGGCDTNLYTLLRIV